jgi:hypothetical protein
VPETPVLANARTSLFRPIWLSLLVKLITQLSVPQATKLSDRQRAAVKSKAPIKPAIQL